MGPREARRASDAPDVPRLRELWPKLTPFERRDALALYWREIRVGPRSDDGGVPLTFVARGPEREAEVELGRD